jgi:hypothetical protein
VPGGVRSERSARRERRFRRMLPSQRAGCAHGAAARAAKAADT